MRPPLRTPSSPPERRSPTRRTTRALRLRLFLWRWRFLVAATFFGLAGAQAVAELRPAPAATTPVVVAGRELAAGELESADVRVVWFPSAVVPAGSHARPADVVGQALVTGVPAGLPIVAGLLAGDRLAAAGPAGTVVAPVRLTDPAVAALLRAGDRIDLLASGGSADGEPVARRLAERALVLGGPGPANSTDGSGDPPAGLLSGVGSAPDADALTLVAVNPQEAAALAGAVGWAGISAVLVK